MTKRHACPICKQRRVAPLFMVNLSWAIGGAILGAVLTPVVERTGAEMREWLYEGRMNLEEGNRLRGEAVREASAEKHRIATLAFERSWQQAGTPEALAQLGIATCHGWGGLERSWQRGRAMLIEAVRRDGSLAAIYLGDPDVCPKTK